MTHHSDSGGRTTSRGIAAGILGTFFAGQLALWCNTGGWRRELVFYPLTRRVLFRLEPEAAHAMSVRLLRNVAAVPGLKLAVGVTSRVPKSEPVTVFGLTFPNRVGLAAGYDKDGEAWQGLGALGFGHIEVGTVTPGPQPGNPKPRVFRLASERSLINRMGFPGRGADYVTRRLQGSRPGGLVLGVNIGKQQATSLVDAVHDYRHLMDVFAPLADYLAVNISSPNTPELRRLQERGYVEALLTALATRRTELVDRLERPVPILVKLAPDLDDDQLVASVDAVRDAGLDGVIATNTTISRQGIRHRLAGEEGGLSGAGLTARSTEVIRAIHSHTAGSLPIVGVGGIMSPGDARAKIEAGATLVQIYTGLVYEGPGLVRRVVKELVTDNR
jgi:dihydroorotate dehydrogenase